MNAYGKITLMPNVIAAAIFREWSLCHNSQPNIEFGHYFANPVRIASNGPSTVPGVIKAHSSLCTQACDVLTETKQGKGNIHLPVKTELQRYNLHPLYQAIVLIIDRLEIEHLRKRQADGFIGLQYIAQHQNVLIARTGVEAGLSAPISFESLQIESLPLERPDVDGEPNINVIRTSLATAVRFIIGLEHREKFASLKNEKYSLSTEA